MPSITESMVAERAHQREAAKPEQRRVPFFLTSTLFNCKTKANKSSRNYKVVVFKAEYPSINF
jgi:hypothetical protein